MEEGSDAVAIKCAYTELVPIHKIIPNPKNTNEHPESQINLLSKIIDFQGVRHPIVVSNLSGFIVAGHGRLMAAKKLGMDVFPVDYQNFDTPAQEYAFLESDNHLAELSEHDPKKMIENLKDFPDLDLEMLGMPDFEMPGIENGSGESEGEGTRETPTAEVARVKRGDIWKLGQHFVYCEDSTNKKNIEKLLGNNKATDLVYTDPPYGIDIVKENRSGPGGQPGAANLNVEKHKTGKGKNVNYSPVMGDKTTQTARDFAGICFNFGETIMLWGANYYSRTLPEGWGFLFWDKGTGENDFSAGEIAFISNQKRAFYWKHQWCGMFKDSEKNEGGRIHPTQKPIALAEHCFEKFDPDGKTVLDAFLGSGSTLIACERQNRQCFGMELSEHYCDLILERWEKETQGQAELYYREDEGEEKAEGE